MLYHFILGPCLLICNVKFSDIEKHSEFYQALSFIHELFLVLLEVYNHLCSTCYSICIFTVSKYLNKCFRHAFHGHILFCSLWFGHVFFKGPRFHMPADGFTI